MSLESPRLVCFSLGVYGVLLVATFIYTASQQWHSSALLNALLVIGGMFAALGANSLEKNAPSLWGIVRIVGALSFIALFTYDIVYWLFLTHDLPAATRYTYAGICGVFLLITIILTANSARKRPFFPRKGASMV